MNVGDELVDARTQRGLSIEQLSTRTKIGAATLRAIEANDVARLPAGIFTRGFLRAYAREVGMDAEDTVARYLAQFQSTEPVEPSEPLGTAFDDSQPSPASRDAGWLPQFDEADRRGWMTTTAAMLALALILYFAFDTREPRTAAAPEDVGSAQSGSAADASTTGSAAPAPVATAGDGAAPAATGGATFPLRVELRASGLVWVTAHADGTRVVYQLLQPGERRTIDGSREVVVRAGDAGNLTASVNDAPGRPLGAAGQVVTVRFAPEG